MPCLTQPSNAFKTLSVSVCMCVTLQSVSVMIFLFLLCETLAALFLSPINLCVCAPSTVKALRGFSAGHKLGHGWREMESREHLIPWCWLSSKRSRCQSKLDCLSSANPKLFSQPSQKLSASLCCQRVMYSRMPSLGLVVPLVLAHVTSTCRSGAQVCCDLSVCF